MPHIALPPDLPGISSAFAYRPSTAKPMRELAEVLLRGPNTLSSGEREMIAAYVSVRNECDFCHLSHRAAAAHNLGGDYETVDAVASDPASAPISPKMKALLEIAALVQTSGKEVTADVVDLARRQGATDDEIHDTVLIAAAFSMFNRYVDGLAAWTPTEPEAYEAMGQRMAEEGYIRPDGGEQPASQPSIHSLKVTLADVDPPVWRRMAVASDTSLADLATLLVVLMGWAGYHLHRFEADGRGYGRVHPELDEVDDLDEAEYTVGEVLGEVGSEMRWDYDMGDGWQHHLVVEAIDSPDPERLYPTCLAGDRACPPEDSGGPFGYRAFLEVAADPSHPEYGETMEFLGSFDPAAFDVSVTDADLRLPQPEQTVW